MCNIFFRILLYHASQTIAIKKPPMKISEGIVFKKVLCITVTAQPVPTHIDGISPISLIRHGTKKWTAFAKTVVHNFKF